MKPRLLHLVNEKMKRKKKLLITLGVSLLLILTSIVGTFFYYYSHPDSVEQLITKFVSKSTGMTCTIKNLSYSLDPLMVRADEITLGTYEDQTGLHLRLSDLTADMALAGTFGRKALIVEHIRIQKLLMNAPGFLIMPDYMTEKGSPSFLSKIVEWAVTWFMFRDISIEEVTVSDGQITSLFEGQRMEIKRIRANMNSDHLIGISCNLIFEWPSQGILFTAPEIHVTTQDAISLKNPQIAGSLEASNATFQSPVIDLKEIGTKGRIQYSQEKNAFDFGPIEFQAHDVQLKQNPEILWLPFPMKAKLLGSLNVEDRKLSVTELDVNVDDTFHMEGNMEIEIGTQTDIRLDILKGSLLSDRFLAFLPNDVMRTIKVSVSGPISFQGTMNGQKKDEHWDFHTDLHAGLDANGFSYIKDRIRFDTILSGAFHVSGEHPKLSLSGELESEQIRMDLDARNLPIEQVRIEFTKGEVDIEHTSLLLPDVRIEISLLRNIHTSLAFEQGLLDLRFYGEDVQLIESAQMLGFIPSEWQFEGISDLKLDAVQNEEKGWTFNSQINLRHLTFENANTGYLGDALSLLLDINGELDHEGSTVDFRTALTADKGEILMDRFYLDLKNNGFKSYLQGVYEVPKKRLQLSSHQIHIKNILDLTLNGTFHFGAENPHADLSIKIPKTPLKSLFHHLVLEPFQTEIPLFASFDLSGDVSAELSFAGSTTEWMIKGLGWWNEGRFTLADTDFDLSGIDLDLPIWLQTQNNGQQPAPVRGKLSIQSLQMPIVDSQPLELSLKMYPNRFSVEEPTILMVQGGVAEVGPILFENILSSKRSIKTKIRLNGIDTDPLLSQLLPIQVNGTIEGDLDAVRFEENTVHSSGQIRTQAFGGEILISDPGISDLFSSFPLYKTNISIKNINLYELTKGTSFGEIEGILQGHIRDLEIANGQPQKFELLLETVKIKGVDQKISVRAVDNISSIGGGSSPFMGLAGVLAGVIKKFPYSKIGIRSSLLNDAFRINGTIKENGQEYLVKRGSFSGVNVVNQNPDTWISFKDMVKRIGRVTASKKDPEID